MKNRKLIRCFESLTYPIYANMTIRAPDLDVER